MSVNVNVGVSVSVGANASVTVSVSIRVSVSVGASPSVSVSVCTSLRVSAVVDGGQTARRDPDGTTGPLDHAGTPKGSPAPQILDLGTIPMTNDLSI